MTRLLYVVAVAAVAPSTANAGPKVTEATSPCVNREQTEWRQVRDAKLDDKALVYCTGDDCWSFDLAKTVKPIAKIPAPATTSKSNELVVAGKVVATATATQVSFCPTGPTSCKQFTYKLKTTASLVSPVMNVEGTLGAVIYHGEEERGAPSYVITFDLAAGKQLKQTKAHDAQVLHSVFVIDDTFYSASSSKLGKLAVSSHGWERLGSTDLIAMHDTAKGELVIQDAKTGKVKGRIPLGVADHEVHFALVATNDGARVYAIGSAADEGEVLTIDVATAKLTSRTTPTVCAANTHRVN